MSEKTIYNFKVVQSIYYELFEKKYESKVTYKLEIIEHYNSKIEIKRHNFKVDDKEVTTKFERIAHAYNDALFPVLFAVKDGAFSLINYSEISERLNRLDKELKLKHEGSGFNYIRESFLEKAAKDGNAMIKYLYSFGLISMLRFCLEKKENDDNYHFYWNIHPLECELFWKGKKHFTPDSNLLKYEGQCNGDKELLDIIKTT